MIKFLPEIKVKNRLILAVPAVHYRASFAEYVNRACSGEAPLPEAIAVELGASAVAAIVSWFRELGIGQQSRVTLPCMLGLFRKNQFIHPSFKQLAMQLQGMTGKYLPEIDPELLRKHLGFSAISIVCLSPTDSIIEAIRCALELNIPVYGIDLDHFSMIEHNSFLIEDPIMAQAGLIEYVNRNGRFSENARDEFVDGRREYVMAARLKCLLQKHKRVLFTGGLAHWNSLQLLLKQTSLKAAADVPSNGTSQYQRVLVHPSIAIRQMDIFPKITALYEQRRLPVNQHRRKYFDFIDYNAVLRELLQECYTRYYSDHKGKNLPAERRSDCFKIPQFEVLLINYSTLKQRNIPSIYDTIQVAESAMSSSFCETIADTMMSFDWISPKDYPELPVLEPDPVINGENSRIAQINRVTLLVPRREQHSKNEKISYMRTKSFYFSEMPENESSPATIEHIWRWKDHPTGFQSIRKGEQCRIWPPHDLLVLGSAYQAGRMASKLDEDNKIERFEGSLLDGLDIKATLRSTIRGENQLYVRNTAKNINSPEEHQAYLDPSVFIFSEYPDSDYVEWNLYAGSMNYHYRRHMKNLDRFNEVIDIYGDILVQAVGFLRKKPVPVNLKPFVLEANHLYGLLYFECPCQNGLQESKWLEETDFQRAPIFRNGGISELVDMYAERHHITLREDDWITTLIRLALPYARKRVIVIVPPGYNLQSIIFEEARAFRIQIAVIPLTFFSAERIAKMRLQYSVEPEDRDGLHYPRELERLLGQSVNTYSHLLPKHILYQNERDGG